MLLKITLMCLSLRVILDLLNQVVNVDAMWSFHHRIRHARDVEVDVFSIDCKVELVRVWWCSITMSGRTKFLHCVCVCVCLIPRVSPFYRELSWRDCLHLSQVSPFCLKKTVYQQSLVNGTFFLSPQKTRSISAGFPVRSQIGLGLDWVGLEDSARGASPKDCWTSFPTGWCSTVEPDWSFPLVQLWSCFNEIFGGGRGDKYRLSNKTSPVFNLSTFWNAISWKCSLKNNCIRSCLIEC